MAQSYHKYMFLLEYCNTVWGIVILPHDFENPTRNVWAEEIVGVSRYETRLQLHLSFGQITDYLLIVWPFYSC